MGEGVCCRAGWNRALLLTALLSVLCRVAHCQGAFPEPRWEVPSLPSYERTASLHTSGTPAPGSGLVTLVTQGHLERLMVTLPIVARQWGCAMSVAVFLRYPRNAPESAGQLEQVRSLFEQLRGTITAPISLSVMYANSEDDGQSSWTQFIDSCQNRTCSLHEAKAQVEAHYPLMYPVNSLRNLAGSQVTTPLTFTVDSDLVPSPNMCASIEGRKGDAAVSSTAQRVLEMSARGHGMLLVVPAFSLSEGVELPQDKAQVNRLIIDKKAASFKAGQYQWGHGPTDVPKWLATALPYRITYQGGYEPYTVGPTRLLPQYSEKFLGYGKNKVQQLWHAAEMGFEFTVLPSVFVCHAEHTFTMSRDVFDAPTKIIDWDGRVFYSYRPFRFFVRWLYSEFQREVRSAMAGVSAANAGLAREALHGRDDALGHSTVVSQADGSKMLTITRVDETAVTTERVHITEPPLRRNGAHRVSAEAATAFWGRGDVPQHPEPGAALRDAVEQRMAERLANMQVGGAD